MIILYLRSIAFQDQALGNLIILILF